MDADAIKTRERRFFEHVNSKDMNAICAWIDNHVAEDFVNHTPSFDVAPDREGLKEMFRQLIETFPDITITIDQMIFENDTLCFRHTVRGTNTVPLAGIPATNKRFEIMGIAMVGYKNGKITDRWVVTDLLGQLQQLGILP